MEIERVEAMVVAHSNARSIPADQSWTRSLGLALRAAAGLALACALLAAALGFANDRVFLVDSSSGAVHPAVGEQGDIAPGETESVEPAPVEQSSPPAAAAPGSNRRESSRGRARRAVVLPGADPDVWPDGRDRPEKRKHGKGRHREDDKG